MTEIVKVTRHKSGMCLEFHPMALEVLKYCLLNFSVRTIKPRQISTSKYEEVEDDQEILNDAYAEWNAEAHLEVHKWLPEIAKNNWMITTTEMERFIQLINLVRIEIAERNKVTKRTMERPTKSSVRVVAELNLLGAIQESLIMNLK